MKNMRLIRSRENLCLTVIVLVLGGAAFVTYQKNLPQFQKMYIETEAGFEPACPPCEEARLAGIAKDKLLKNEEEVHETPPADLMPDAKIVEDEDGG